MHFSSQSGTMGRKPKGGVMAVGAEERSQLVNELLERVGQTVGQRAQVSTIFGEPVERERLTVIPVAKVRFGFGGGGDAGSEFKRITSATDLLPLVAAASLAGLTLKRVLA